jgi:hypothetical protein
MEGYVSAGSISNILNSKTKNNRNQTTDSEKQSRPNASLSTAINQNNISSPSSSQPRHGVGLTILPEELEESIEIKRAEKAALEVEIEESRKTLDAINAELKAVEDFKTEVKKYGLDIDTDFKKFVDCLKIFQQFNFDYNKMVEAFLDIQDVVTEKENVQQLKKELDKQQEIINYRLEQVGFGDFEQLKQTVIALMTLRDNIGISQEMIISLSHEQLAHQRVQYANQKYGYGYSYTNINRRF